MEPRPTPEEIQQAVEDQHDGGLTSEATIDEFLEALAGHGYRIVHPDDVQEMEFGGGIDDGYVSGFNDGRGAVLGLWDYTRTDTGEA